MQCLPAISFQDLGNNMRVQINKKDHAEHLYEDLKHCVKNIVILADKKS